MLEAIGAAFCGSQPCNGKSPLRNARSKAHTPRVSPGCNWPFIMEKNRRSTAYCVAGTRAFIADEVSKTSRKRLSTRLAAGCACRAGVRRIPAPNMTMIRAHRANRYENVGLFIGFYFYVGG